MKKYVFIGCFLSVFCSIYAQEVNYVTGQEISDEYNVIVTGVQFLSLTPDSRASAMADVGVATSTDIWSQAYNASKYSLAENKYGVGLSYVPWFRNLGVKDEKLLYLSGYMKPGDNDAIGASIRYFNMGDVPSYDDEGNAEGYSVSPREFSIDASYSRRLTKSFSMGMTGRFIYSNMIGESDDNTHTGKSVSFDVSGIYTKKIHVRRTSHMFSSRGARYTNTDLFQVGFCFSNIGSKISYSADGKDFIPANLALGVGYSKNIDNMNSLSFYVDVNKLLVPTPPIYEYDDQGNVVNIQGKNNVVGVMKGLLQSFYDAPNGFVEELKEWTVGYGIEYWYDRMVAARLGYFNEAKTKGNRKYFTSGLGFRYDAFVVDFSYMLPVNGKKSPLANTFRFSLSCEF